MDTKSYTDYDNTNVHIYHVDMPYSVASNIIENPDGSFTMYINSRLSYERQLKGYMHEIQHLENNDLDNCYDVQSIELNVREK